MKNIVSALLICLFIVSCKKDNASSYEGNYDVEIVSVLGQKSPGTMLITENSGNLTINVKSNVEDDEASWSFEAVDNGDDYFEVTPCALCVDDETSIKSGEVRKVDNKVSIELQLHIDDGDGFEMDFGIEIHEK